MGFKSLIQVVHLLEYGIQSKEKKERQWYQTAVDEYCDNIITRQQFHYIVMLVFPFVYCK